MSDKDVVKNTNGLARQFYSMMGHTAPPEYKFWKATHPQECMCWSMAVIAMEELRQTDVENALDELGW